MSKSKMQAGTQEGKPPVRIAADQLITVPIGDLIPSANNPRIHSKAQIAKLRGSLREFGFVAPVLADHEGNVIAGQGMLEAALAEDMTEVPCVTVSGLTDAQRRGYILADNRLGELSSWDVPMLKIELGELEAMNFDIGVICFDAASLDAFSVEPSNTMGVELEETDEYRQFVAKFRHKMTTDDCYTPENVYDAVKSWVVRRYHLEGAEVLRPFWPGGDYQAMDYPDGCVVIDNPPFSILSEICRFYLARGIHFFLFAPGLTLFSIASGRCNYVVTGISVTYANGANVNTSFVTDMGEYKVEVEPELYKIIEEAEAQNRSELAPDLPMYIYPNYVLSVAINKLAKRGLSLRVKPEDAAFIRALDAQKARGKAIFGSGFLISERAAAELATAERTVAELAAAELAAAIRWSLSDREMCLVRSLGDGGDTHVKGETADGSAPA